jgi:hypothetical protein
LQAQNEILKQQLEDRKLEAYVCKLQAKNHANNLENTELKEQVKANKEEFQKLNFELQVFVQMT